MGQSKTLGKSIVPNGNKPINTIVTACPFDLAIRVAPSVYTPLELEEFDHDGWKKWKDDSTVLTPFVPGSGKKGKEKVTFVIQISKNDIDSLIIEIVDFDPKLSPKGKVLYKFDVQMWKNGLLDPSKKGSNFTIGEWKLEWDGYISDILDTRLFKNPNIRIRATGSKTCGIKGNTSIGVKEAYTAFNGEPFQSCSVPADWLDVTIDRNAKTVEVEWRVQFDDGGVSGNKTAKTPSYTDLQNMAVIGIQKYWSRIVGTAFGKYQIKINPLVTAVNATPSMTLQVQMDSSFERSSNSSCACSVGFFSGIGNTFDDTTRTWYLLGFYKGNRSVADSQFKVLIAHEMGHPVLASYAYKDGGPNNYSWVHKGSSKGLLSKYATPKLGEKGYEAIPSPMPVEMDLMKYYTSYIPPANQKANEYDVKMLVWLSNIKIGG